MQASPETRAPRTPAARLARLMAAVLLATAVSACLSGSEATLENVHESDPPSDVVVEAEPGVFVPVNRAVVRGLVRNDAGFLLKDATVVLVGTSFVHVTGEDGAFSFHNVTVGSHVLRVEKTDFSPFEEALETTAGNVTAVEVYLLPVDSRGPGLNPHIHDFWAGADSVTLMDQSYDLLEDRGYQCGAVPFIVCTTAYWGSSNSTSSGWNSWVLVLPKDGPDGRPPIILPGTATIEFKLNWDTTRTQMDRMAVAYIAADSKTRQFLKPEAPGTVMKISINQTMADTGHQRFSLWQFWLFTDNKPQGGGKSGLNVGSVHVQMVLKRGDIYLEPPHENHWGGKNEIVLREKTPPISIPCSSCTFPFEYRSRDWGYSLPLGKLVPPGAKRMRIEMTWSYPQGSLPTDPAHDLTWRTADQYPQGTRPGAYQRATPKEDAAGKKVWDFELKPEWTDAFYQKKSNWLFAIWLKPFPEEGYFVEPRKHDVSLEIIVYKDPAYVTS